MAYVVLLHFAQPVNPDYPARHYLEYAENIAARLRDHTAGDRTRTSGIMFACYERNISFVVARIWRDATRRDEYRLRQLGKNPKLCPICNPALALYTPYLPNDPNTWLSIRQQPDVITPRYGDIETLKPYSYKPKHRTRRNGEHNRTSGNASTWRKDTREAIKAQLAPLNLPGMPEFVDHLDDGYLDMYRDSIAPLQLTADAQQLIEQRKENERAIASALGVPPDVLFAPLATIHAPYKQNQPPQDTDHAPTGFDTDLPY